jgi:hypothetical protein
MLSNGQPTTFWALVKNLGKEQSKPVFVHKKVYLLKESRVIEEWLASWLNLWWLAKSRTLYWTIEGWSFAANHAQQRPAYHILNFGQKSWKGNKLNLYLFTKSILVERIHSNQGVAGQLAESLVAGKIQNPLLNYWGLESCGQPCSATASLPHLEPWSKIMERNNQNLFFSIKSILIKRIYSNQGVAG